MRIIAGSAKGRRLRSLRGGALRPTADRVREAMFGTLGERVVEARFLDLYAGVGTVGLEALSRGAAEVVFVESHRAAGRVIAQNAELCGFGKEARVVTASVERALGLLRREGAEFEVVFADPPYEVGEAGAVMERLAREAGLVAEGGLVICQHSRREPLEEKIGDFWRKKASRFGETIVDFYQTGGQTVDSSSVRGNV